MAPALNARLRVIAHHTPKYQCRPTRMMNQSVVPRMTMSMELVSVIALASFHEVEEL